MFFKKIEENLAIAIEEMGWEMPTEIQKAAFPKIKSGKNICITASQKKGSSCLLAMSVIQKLKTSFEDVPRAVITVGSEDKVKEMGEIFSNLAKHTDLRIVELNSKENLLNQRDRVYFGSDIVIGTPKMFTELYTINGINLNGIKMFVVDDANQLIKDQLFSHLNQFANNVPKCQYVINCNQFNSRIECFIEDYADFAEYLQLD
ncbi:MAG: DEAD/DEAH box helicase [Marinifilaceae bacterium]|jgi:superfamily II DNA/RNA helicase|nr:DEAD/DEAH box helicase [Marinifilaceae bacterium]